MSEPGPLILMIEDEKPIRNFVRAALDSQGFRLVECEQGKEGISLAASHNHDLILLDLGLPDMDGLGLIEQVRTWTMTPIIVISARGQEADKISALERGADDYLTKPFGVGELLARMRVALRHTALLSSRGPGSSVFACEGLHIDFEKRTVRVEEEEVHLTPIEYKLLVVLAKHAGKVLTHNHLLHEVWGKYSTEQNHYVRIYMASLRKKIEKDPSMPRYILTETGIGYRLREPF